jgi:hypothetical protein
MIPKKQTSESYGFDLKSICPASQVSMLSQQKVFIDDCPELVWKVQTTVEGNFLPCTFHFSNAWSCSE